jgi:hypothetical protein
MADIDRVCAVVAIWSERDAASYADSDNESGTAAGRTIVRAARRSPDAPHPMICGVPTSKVSSSSATGATAIRCGRRKRSFEIRIERKAHQKVFKTLGAWPGVNCFISEILLPCADSNVANFVRLIARPKEPGLTGTASPTPSTQGAKGQLSKVLLTKAA